MSLTDCLQTSSLKKNNNGFPKNRLYITFQLDVQAALLQPRVLALHNCLPKGVLHEGASYRVV